MRRLSRRAAYKRYLTGRSAPGDRHLGPHARWVARAEERDHTRCRDRPRAARTGVPGRTGARVLRQEGEVRADKALPPAEPQPDPCTRFHRFVRREDAERSTCRTPSDETTCTEQTRVDELSHSFCKGQVALDLIAGDDHWWVAGGRSPPRVGSRSGAGRKRLVLNGHVGVRQEIRPERPAVRAERRRRRPATEPLGITLRSRDLQRSQLRLVPFDDGKTDVPAAPIASGNVRTRNRTTASAMP
jgi:hypothetical protein